MHAEQMRTGVEALQEDKIDVTRSVHNAVYGGLVNGTLGHMWYVFASCKAVAVRRICW